MALQPTILFHSRAVGKHREGAAVAPGPGVVLEVGGERVAGLPSASPRRVRGPERQSGAATRTVTNSVS